MVDEHDSHKTAFLTKYILFEHIRMAQGLCNAPATFQRVMNLVLRGLACNKILVYLDDVIVLGRSFEESLKNLFHMLFAVCATHISVLSRVENMMPFAMLRVLSTGLSIEQPRETIKNIILFIFLDDSHVKQYRSIACENCGVAFTQFVSFCHCRQMA